MKKPQVSIGEWLMRHFGLRAAESSERSRRDVRALMTSVAGISYRMIDAGLKLMIIPLATRLLGIEEYGVWLTANALLSLLMVSDFGIGSGVINAVGGALARREVSAARSYLATAYVAFGVLALYVAGTVTWLSRSSLLPRWLGIQGHTGLVADSRHLFVIMGLLISTAAFLNVINFFVSSLQEGYLAHCAQIGASITALICILNLHTRSMTRFALATALPIVAAYILLSLYIFGVRHRDLLPVFTQVKMSSFRIMWKDGSRLLIAQIADTILAFMSSVLVASHLGASHVPEVSVSLQVMMIVNYVACMFILPLWPAYVEAGERGDHGWTAIAFHRGALRSIGCVVLATVTYALIYKQFIHRWSPLLPIPSRTFVLVLCVWFVIYVWNKNPMVLLNALGFTEVRAWVAPLAAATFVGSAWLMLPRFGIVAIPLAGCISALLEACFTTTRALALLSNHKLRPSTVAEIGPVLSDFNQPTRTGSELSSSGVRSWVIVHDAWRDQYQLPGAFAEAGMLERFVTDWYTPADQPLWARALKRSPLGAVFGLRTRFSPLVPSAQTKDQKARFLVGLIRRKWNHERFDDVLEGAKSGRRAAKIANRSGSHLLSASYSAAAAFERLNPGLARVLFQVHPQPRFLRDLYQRQITIDADYAGLIAETEFQVDERSMSAWEQEAELADQILCASSFSKRSLIWSGVPADRISVVPYGVDTSRFVPGKTPPTGPFKVLFVGQRVARKGLRALLRAWKNLQPQGAELILAGGHQADALVTADFEGLYTDIPRMSAESLVQLYQQADVFVLPSLAEGFGHVYLEALACGTPVLCTENTGAADLVVDGVNGWTIPAADLGALEAQLSWILRHRDEVRAMRTAARASAERYTWPRFRESVREAASLAATRREVEFHAPVRREVDQAELVTEARS